MDVGFDGLRAGELERGLRRVVLERPFEGEVLRFVEGVGEGCGARDGGAVGGEGDAPLACAALR